MSTNSNITNPLKNRSQTNLEAWVDYGTDWMATSTTWLKGNLASEFIIGKVAATIDTLVWGTPWLTARLAFKTFLGALFVGGMIGICSLETMNNVFENIDSILEGRERKEKEGKEEKAKHTNLKVSLIFAIVIVSKLLPIFPSLPKFYAAGGGFLFGLKASQWIPEKYAVAGIQYANKCMPFLPQCPGFVPKSSAD